MIPGERINMTSETNYLELEEHEKICSDIGHEWEHVKTLDADKEDDYVSLVEYMCIYCGLTKQEYRLEENNNNNWRMGFFHFDF